MNRAMFSIQSSLLGLFNFKAGLERFGVRDSMGRHSDRILK